MSAPVYVVLGAGPGLGAATARRFGESGHDVVLAARTPQRLDPVLADIRDEGISAAAVALDLTDPGAVSAAIKTIGTRYGRIDVLHFNPSAWRAADILTLTPADLLEDLRLGVAPLLPAVQAAVEFMPTGGRVLVTGSLAAEEPNPAAPSLGVQKAGLRNLVTSLDATLSGRGIRAVCVQVNGTLAREGPFSPAVVADALYAATVRPDTEWTAQVDFDGEPR